MNEAGFPESFEFIHEIVLITLVNNNTAGSQAS
jgi:hypothetical protein